MRTTIVITTKNRKSELATALRSAVLQEPKAEIIVVDDGSTDGTEDMIRKDFPGITIQRYPESRGYIARRNDGARLANGDILFSIDDDAEFSSPDIVAQTLSEFSHPAIGAIAIPYIDVRKSDCVNQKAPDQLGTWITDAFVGTAHAVRKDVFLALGGYREDLIHQGEEMDFCVRMLEAGFVVRLGNAKPIDHHESERRDHTRMDRYGTRNAILFAWQNCPAVLLPVHLGVTTIRLMLWTLDWRRLRIRAVALIEGYLGMTQHRRQPVRLRTYRLFRRLKKNGPMRFDSDALGFSAKNLALSCEIPIRRQRRPSDGR
jgi:glycosyltransferase involved in cell wall biosynthesis